MYNFGTPWGWKKFIETCRSDYNINIVKIIIHTYIYIYCALVAEIKTISYYIHKDCVRGCNEEVVFYQSVLCVRETESVREILNLLIFCHTFRKKIFQGLQILVLHSFLREGGDFQHRNSHLPSLKTKQICIT